MRRSVSWCAKSRDSKPTFNNNLMQTWHYTFGPHAPQTQVLCGFLNRPTAATVEDGLDCRAAGDLPSARARSPSVVYLSCKARRRSACVAGRGLWKGIVDSVLISLLL